MIRWLTYGFAALVFSGLLAAGGALYALTYFGRDLPDYRQLAEYEPPIMTRIHAGDGSLIAEVAREQRLFVPIDVVPDQVIGAFLSAEDKTFYTHPGVDIWGIARAVVVNARNMITGRRPVGASTITQQVAKNFLLTNEVSYERKIKEAILAFRIERAFTKDQILELYLNEIYLGQGTYGVAAASLKYFGKALDELNVEEAAYLAALPKAPNNYHPIRNRGRAISRRNWILNEMEDNGYLTADEAEAAARAPLLANVTGRSTLVNARYFVSAVRRDLIDLYGDRALFEEGLSVRTTVEPDLQNAAHQALRKGLAEYDRRNGWRGPIENWTVAGEAENNVAVLPDREEMLTRLASLQSKDDLAPWSYAVVTQVDKNQAAFLKVDEQTGKLLLRDLQWAKWRIPPTDRELARAAAKGEYPSVKLGSAPKAVDEVLKVGDVILVTPLAADPDHPHPDGKGAQRYGLRQVPEVNGALIAMDPHTGRVLALVGGFSHARTRFNRATQAARQPGSAFKPFVYAAALDNGFTPSSLVLDAPFVIEQGPGQPRWKPANYSDRFYGPSTLRLGIEKSRNLMTVRLAQHIGMDVVSDYARRFEIMDRMPKILSMSLGAGEASLMKMTTAYAMLVNGGKKVTPRLIDRVQDRRGKTVYRSDDRGCLGCKASEWAKQSIPVLRDTRPQVIEEETAYQIVSMLEGAVERGTGTIVKSVGKPLAGKTGTTNNSRDAWFVGFSPDLVAGVYVGFDTPRSLGRKETGSSVAAPIFRDFMAEALKEAPAIPFRIPEGVRLVRVNARTGLPARRGDNSVVLEAFRPGTEPSGQQQVLDKGYGPSGGGNAAISGTGGLY